MASHRSHTYQPIYPASRRPHKSGARTFLTEWLLVLVMLVLAGLVIGMALQLPY